jgi:hypothetical protein
LSGFLAAIGEQLAQRWATVLVLPGLVFLAIAAAGHVLGQTHSFDVTLLIHYAEKLAAHYDGRPVDAVLTVAGIALGAVAAALLAQGLGTAARSLWLVDRLPGPFDAPIRHLVKKRRQQWNNADEAYRDYQKESSAAAPGAGGERGNREEQLAILADKRNRIALARPVRPTWMGDRIAAASSRIHGQYSLSLDFVWPRLWLILPDLVRSEIKDARDSFDRSATLQGWGLLYIALGIEWWPAAIAGLFTTVLAWRRGRASIGVLADLVESAFDLYTSNLVTSLGFEKLIGSGTGDWKVVPNTDNWAAVDEWIRKGS